MLRSVFDFCDWVIGLVISFCGIKFKSVEVVFWMLLKGFNRRLKRR